MKRPKIRTWAAGLLVGLVLATALPLLAQTVRDYSGHLRFVQVNPEIQYYGTLLLRSMSGQAATTVASLDSAGAINLPLGIRPTALSTAATTLAITSNHCGRAIISIHTTATQTFTLPASASVPGCEVTFIAGNAGTEILIDTAGASEIVNIMTWAAVGTDADTARVIATSDTSAIKNTAATNVLGDHVVLVADGILTWYGKGITNGIWAAQ